MVDCKKICKNCDNSFTGFGESSMHFGLRCHEKESSVDENDTCELFELSSFLKLKNLEEKLAEKNKQLELSQKREAILKEAVMFYANKENAGYYYKTITSERARKALKEVEEVK